MSFRAVDSKGGIITSATGILANSSEGNALPPKPTFGLSNAAPFGSVTTSTLAAGAIQGLAGVSIGSLPSTASSIPRASTMRATAKIVEQKAQALLDETIYTTYKTIFDAIEVTAQSGSYSYSTMLTTQQINELSGLLVKNGYTVTNIVDSKVYNIQISW